MMTLQAFPECQAFPQGRGASPVTCLVLYVMFTLQLNLRMTPWVTKRESIWRFDHRMSRKHFALSWGLPVDKLRFHTRHYPETICSIIPLS